MKKTVVIFAMLFLLTGCEQKDASTQIKEISCEEAKKGHGRIVDVRSAIEYSLSHLDNAINIDVNEIEKIEEVIKDKKTPIILYCQSGKRSKIASEKLIELGYTNISNVTEGFQSCKLNSESGE